MNTSLQGQSINQREGPTDILTKHYKVKKRNLHGLIYNLYLENHRVNFHFMPILNQRKKRICILIIVTRSKKIHIGFMLNVMNKQVSLHPLVG